MGQALHLHCLCRFLGHFLGCFDRSGKARPQNRRRPPRKKPWSLVPSPKPRPFRHLQPSFKLNPHP